MKHLTLVLTNACNQDCSYCYQQRNSSRMEFNVAKEAVDYYVRNYSEEPEMTFYGGEPFLEYDLMRRIIEYSQKQWEKSNTSPRFSVTTNGTLLDREKIEYCRDSNVHLMLSVDGIEQAHEIGRGKGSFQKVQDVMYIIKEYPELSLSTVSVVTPMNVKYLSESVRFLVEQGVDRLLLTFQLDEGWNPDELRAFREEYEKAYTYLILNKRKGGKAEFDEYGPPDPLKSVFQCSAGDGVIVVTPEGELYSCLELIPWSRKAVEMNTIDHFAGLSLGHITDLGSKKVEKRREAIRTDERLIGQYFRHTTKEQCGNCDYIELCGVCPVAGMIYSDDPCFVPDWICSIKKIVIDVASKFWQ